MFIHSLIDGHCGAFFYFGAIIFKHCYEYSCTSFCLNTHFSLGWIARSGISGSNGNSILVIWLTDRLFPKWLQRFTLSSTMYESSKFFTEWTLVIVSRFYCNCPDDCSQWPHWAFDGMFLMTNDFEIFSCALFTTYAWRNVY